MAFGALADLVVVVHAAFLVFVGVGALWVRHAPAVAWFHAPAVGWGAAAIALGVPCPLTALEKRLRRAAGENGYAGGFVDRYIEDVVVPDELTPVLWAVAAAVIIVTYTSVVAQALKKERPRVA